MAVMARRSGPGTGRKGDINVTDLHAAILLLEKTIDVQSWELTRINNPMHMVPPLGLGFGLRVCHTLPDGETVRIWEKAGSGRPLLLAAESAIKRLKAELADWRAEGK
jgi:hypothetical protein